MEEFKKLMEYAWSLGKYFFNRKPSNIEEYEKYTELANDLLKTQKPGTKEYIFLRKLLAAVNEYTDTLWREENNSHIKI